MQLLASQLGGCLGTPSRGDGGLTNAKVVDVQAGYDGANAIFIAVAGGSDLILHNAGWAEGGRCTDANKLVREGQVLHD